MPKKKRLKRSSWLTCCKRTTSSTTLVSDIDSVSQTSRQTEERLQHTAGCQACRHEEKQTRRKRFLKFWKSSGSKRCSEQRADQKTGIVLVDIISETEKSETVVNGIVDDIIHKALSETKETIIVPGQKQNDSEGKWLKTNTQPSPLTSESYVAIDVKEFIQKINTNHPEDPVEVVRSRKQTNKTRTLSNGRVSLDTNVEHQPLKDMGPQENIVQNVQSVILSHSDGDEVVPVVAEASQTIAQRIFYIDEGSRVSRITGNNEDVALDNKIKLEVVDRPEGWLFTVSDHAMDRKTVRSPRREPKRIVKKVVEDIQTRHIQGISETEVKFKKKKTPIVRHVSQAVQTIVSNVNIVEDKVQSKENTKNKYKRELAAKSVEANPVKTNLQRDRDKVLTEHDYGQRDTDGPRLQLLTENGDTKNFVPEFHTCKADADKLQPDTSIVTRNSTYPDLQHHTRQPGKDTIEKYVPIRRYDSGFETHVFSTKADERRSEIYSNYETGKVLTTDLHKERNHETDSHYPTTKVDMKLPGTKEQNKNEHNIEKLKPEITPEKPKRRPIMREQNNEMDHQAYHREVAKYSQQENIDHEVTAPHQTLTRKTENAMTETHRDRTMLDPLTKIPHKELICKEETKSELQKQSDTNRLKHHANMRNTEDKHSERESSTTDKVMSKYQNHEIQPESQTARRNMGVDIENLNTETRTDRKKTDERHEHRGLKYTYASRSDLYTDRDRIVKFKYETHANVYEPAINSGVRDTGELKSGPHTTKSDTDKSTELTVYEADPTARLNCIGSVNRENNRNTRFGHVFPPMQPAMTSWYRSYVGETGELFTNSDIEPEAIRLGAGLLQASARLVNRKLTGEENLENDQPVQEQTQYKIPQERGNLAEAGYSNGSTDEERLLSLGFTKIQVTQALNANDNDVCRAAEWLFSGSDIDSRESPRTRARQAREAHANQALHTPLDLIPEDIQEFYNKKKVPPTNKEEYERDLALALLEVEPVPQVASGSDIMGERNLEQVNSVAAFYSTCDAPPCIKHGRPRTDGDGAEDTTDDDRTETSATSGSRTEDEAGSRPGSGPKVLDSETMAGADASSQSQKSSGHADAGDRQGADQGQGCYIM